MRRVRLAVLIAAVTTLVGVVLVTGAGAGKMGDDAPLTIEKDVVGPVPPGTTFTVTVTCDPGTITNGESDTTFVATFDAAGNPTSQDTAFFEGETECTVTETATGGASSVAYACEGEFPQEEELPEGEGFSAQGFMGETPCGTISAGGVQVFIESPQQFATVTVTNTFTAPPPTPAPAVVAQPAFTG